MSFKMKITIIWIQLFISANLMSDPLYTLHGFTGSPKFIKVHPDNGHVIVGSPENFMFVNLSNKDIISASKIKGQWIMDQKFDDNGYHTALSYYDKFVSFRRHDLYNNKFIYYKEYSYPNPKLGILNRNSDMMAIITEENKILILDTNSMILDQPTIDSVNDIKYYDLHYSNDNKFLIGITNKFLFVYSLEDKKVIRKIDMDFIDKNWKVRFLPDNDHFVQYNTGSNNFNIYSLTDTVIIKSITTSERVIDLQFSHDLKQSIGCSQSKVYLYDIEKNIETKLFETGQGFNTVLVDISDVFESGYYSVHQRSVKNAIIEVRDYKSNEIEYSLKTLISLNNPLISNDNEDFVINEQNQTHVLKLNNGHFLKTIPPNRYRFHPKSNQFYFIKDSIEAVFLDYISLDTISKFKFNQKATSLYCTDNYKYYQIKFPNKTFECYYYKWATDSLVFFSDSSLGYNISNQEKFIHGYEGRDFNNERFIVRKFPSGEKVFDFTAEAKLYYSPKYSENDDYLLIRKYDNTGIVQKYSLSNYSLIESISISKDVVGDNYYIIDNFDGQNNRLEVSGRSDGSVIIRNITKANVIENIKGFGSPVKSMILSNDRKYLLILYDIGSLRVYQMPVEIWSSVKIIDDNNLQLFPNPASNQIRINFDSDRVPNKYHIVNSLGIIQSEADISSSQLTLDISAYPTGLYFAVFEYADGTRQVEKFIKLGE